jgi:hypothetical protein
VAIAAAAHFLDCRLSNTSETAQELRGQVALRPCCIGRTSHAVGLSAIEPGLVVPRARCSASSTWNTPDMSASPVGVAARESREPGAIPGPAVPVPRHEPGRLSGASSSDDRTR